MTEASTSNDAFRTGLLGDFLDESDELVRTLNANLAALSEALQPNPEGTLMTIDAERVNETFRAAHCLKGLAAMLGLDDIHRLTHEMESAFDAAQCGDLGVGQDMVNAMLARVDHLSALIDALKDQEATCCDDAGRCAGEILTAPIGDLFDRFAYVLHDIAGRLGKDVRLKFQGDQIELDKRTIDALSDPLIHIARNTADHGIELPAQRAAAGKPPYGEVTLAALDGRDRIVVEVRDDGRGLDPTKIVARAIAMRILSDADADRLGTHDIFQLIWTPGFSTADAVTEISGRGVGMDIVKSKIEAVGGNVALHSTPGSGTTVTIELPFRQDLPATPTPVAQ